MRKTTKGHGLLGGALAALVTAVLAVLLAVGLLSYFAGGSGDAVITGIVAVYAVLFLAIAAGVIAALIQRWKEVRGGEEDEAKKY